MSQHDKEFDFETLTETAEEFFDEADVTEDSEEGLHNLAADPKALLNNDFVEALIETSGQDSFDTTNQSAYTEGDIQVLEGLDAVRKRPGMYIGDTTPRGLHHLVYEIVANSVDEAIAGRCDRIDIILNQDGSVTVADDGSGIPVGDHPKMGIPTVEVVHTFLHAGGKFGGGAYSVSGGLHGVGASVVNALSAWMVVEVKRDGNLYRIGFEQGKTVSHLEIVGQVHPDDTGTRTTFLPDGVFRTSRLIMKYAESLPRNGF